MAKRAISITLEEDNLLWLHGQTRGSGKRSVSQIVDGLVADARAAGRVHADSIRSVVGTIEIAATDPGLADADRTIRRLFATPRRRARRPRRRCGWRARRRSRYAPAALRRRGRSPARSPRGPPVR